MINVSCTYFDGYYRIKINDGLHRIGSLQISSDLVEDRDFKLGDMFEAIWSSMNDVRAFVNDEDEFPF